MIRVLALMLMAGPAAAGSLTVELTPRELWDMRQERGTALTARAIRVATGGVRVVQAGRGHTAGVTTTAGNTAVVVQTGSDHTASLTQTGAGQGVLLIQSGTGGAAEVVQQTDGDRVVIVQHSWAPRH